MATFSTHPSIAMILSTDPLELTEEAALEFKKAAGILEQNKTDTKQFQGRAGISNGNSPRKEAALKKLIEDAKRK